ncbi:hypothetical protein Acr_08g0012050 [Actinidia rufa]|uniref:Reverse transcriptase zinc-binding domain-containing protein n=1 Tax=Actinidia rufa TaxID=165716 RepID=A0A7J0F3J6_9ERIC|nr:hypothetical protein Acr_08g0012050 [Actinidia rufa]
MAAMGFPQQFIGWVATCVTTARFSVVINGELPGMDLKWSITYHPKCQALGALNVFYHISGLQPNVQKRAIYLSGVSMETTEEIKTIFPIPNGFLPVKYRGILGEFESLLKGFLWTGAALKKTGAKLQWSVVSSQFGEGIVRNLGSFLQARVSSIICNGDWVWPRQRNRAIMNIMAHTPKILSQILGEGNKVLWTPTADGRWAFMEWLCCWGRQDIKDRFQLNRKPSGWSIELHWATQNLVSSNFGNNLYQLVLSAAVHNIWGGRNARILNNRGRELDSVPKGIERDGDRCCTLKKVENTYIN